MKLTTASLRSLLLPEGRNDAIHFDDELKGFGYRLRRSGGRVLASWIVQYRRASGSRRMLIGSASVLSAEQARNAARKILAKVALGEDPQGDKAKRRDADRLTVRGVIGEYLATKEPVLRPTTFRDTTAYLVGPHFRALHG